MSNTIANDAPSKPPRYRLGFAVVEIAVTLPIFALVTLATIDTCTVIYKRQLLEIVAYEGARVGVVPGAQAENVAYKCDSLLQASGIQDYTLRQTPSDPATLDVGDFFTVEISAPMSSRAISPFFSGSTLTQKVALRLD